MIKFTDYQVTFAEVPDEISLTLSISNCPGKCKGCHSPELREDIGWDLLINLPALIGKYKGMVTCVTLLGEGNDLSALQKAVDIIHEAGLKSCVYYGRDDYSKELPVSTYIKLGHYDCERGGLSNPNTNQRFYKTYYDENHILHFESLTYKFWGKKEEL